MISGRIMGRKMARQSIKDAVIFLASEDRDRCSEKNYAGFNRPDSGPGHRAAEEFLNNSFPRKDAACSALLHRIWKYKTQLIEAGLDLPILRTFDQDFSVITTNHSPDRIEVGFAYSEAKIALVRGIPERKYNQKDIVWTVPLLELPRLRELKDYGDIAVDPWINKRYEILIKKER